MKIKWKQLLFCIAVPLLVGGLSSFFTRTGMKSFETILQPALTPPGWVFGVVWTILYVLMGISSYLVLKAEGEGKTKALQLYVWQLLVNFLWPTLFFNFQWYLGSFLWLVLLLLLVAGLIREFGKWSETAARLNIPYLLWLIFAGYLNFAVWRLNL